MTPRGNFGSEQRLEDTPTPSWRPLIQREAVLDRDERLGSCSGSETGSSSCKTSETALEEEDDESNDRDGAGNGGGASEGSMGAGDNVGGGPTMSICAKVMSKGVHNIAFSMMPDTL